MKDEEKKVNEEVQTEEEGKELTDEELAQVTGGFESTRRAPTYHPPSHRTH